MMNDCDSGLQGFSQERGNWECHYLGSEAVSKEETEHPSAF